MQSEHLPEREHRPGEASRARAVLALALPGAVWLALLALAGMAPTYGAVWEDSFNGTMQDGWQWVREDKAKHSLTARDGYLRITTQRGDIWARRQRYPASNNLKNLLLRTAPAGDFTISTKVDFSPKYFHHTAMLLVYQDDDNYVSIAREYLSKLWQLQMVKEIGGTPETIRKSFSLTTTYLKLEKSCDAYTGYYSADGTTWTKMGSFTAKLSNPRIGLSAQSGIYEAGGSFGQIPADFDWFKCESTLVGPVQPVKPLEPSYVSGTVRNASRQPIAGAVVRFGLGPGRGTLAVTDNNGAYSAGPMPGDSGATVSVTADDYQSTGQSLLIKGGQSTLDFVLTPLPIVLSLSGPFLIGPDQDYQYTLSLANSSGQAQTFTLEARAVESLRLKQAPGGQIGQERVATWQNVSVSTGTTVTKTFTARPLLDALAPKTPQLDVSATKADGYVYYKSYVLALSPPDVRFQCSVTDDPQSDVPENVRIAVILKDAAGQIIKGATVQISLTRPSGSTDRTVMAVEETPVVGGTPLPTWHRTTKRHSGPGLYQVAISARPAGHIVPALYTHWWRVGVKDVWEAKGGKVLRIEDVKHTTGSTYDVVVRNTSDYYYRVLLPNGESHLLGKDATWQPASGVIAGAAPGDTQYLHAFRIRAEFSLPVYVLQSVWVMAFQEPPPGDVLEGIMKAIGKYLDQPVDAVYQMDAKKVFLLFMEIVKNEPQLLKEFVGEKVANKLAAQANVFLKGLNVVEALIWQVGSVAVTTRAAYDAVDVYAGKAAP